MGFHFVLGLVSWKLHTTTSKLVSRKLPMKAVDCHDLIAFSFVQAKNQLISQRLNGGFLIYSRLKDVNLVTISLSCRRYAEFAGSIFGGQTCLAELAERASCPC